MLPGKRQKQWVATLFVGLSCASVFGAAETPSATLPTAPTRPNIVILVADDWGFTDVGAFGGEIDTPHLDALAKKGARFSNFHTAASCAPTRAMLLTGVENHKAGVGNLLETMPGSHRGKPGYEGSLARNVVTMATLFQNSGYRTYITGKWNVGSESHNLPHQRGFDRSIIQGDTGSDNWVPQQRYLPHSAKVEWFEDGKPATMPAEFYSSTYFVDRMIDYLKSDAQPTSGHVGKPFFAYVGFQANHVPIQAPKAFVDKYKGKYQQGWDVLRQQRRDRAAALGLIPAQAGLATQATTRPWDSLNKEEQALQQRQMEVYAAMADAMDHEVGRLIAHLKATGTYDNTVFVFLSDNGAEGSDYKDAQIWLRTQYTQDMDRLGEKGAYGIPGPSWASASVSPLSGFKFYAAEGGIRVPMLISGVRGAIPQQIVQSLTHVTDIAPTLLEVASIAPPGNRYAGVEIEPIVGKSLLPLMLGKATAVRGPSEGLGYELSGNLAYFQGDLKLVKNGPPVGDGQWHLYDIRNDPGETRDLKTALPAEFAAMQASYAVWEKEHGVLPMPAGYDPVRQVLINSMVHYWLPTYGPAGGVLLVLLGFAAVLWKRKRPALSV